MSLDLSDKNLTKLPNNLLNEVNESFDCSYNKLTSLEGSPQEITGNFYCYNNNLTTLKGCPERINYFDCSYNKLTSLEGSPKIVNGSFYCFNNKLTTLESGPKEVGNNFHCSNNPNLSLKEILKFMSKCFIGRRIITDYGDLTKYKNRVLNDREILKILLKVGK